jgi:hypothetical protein
MFLRKYELFVTIAPISLLNDCILFGHVAARAAADAGGAVVPGECDIMRPAAAKGMTWTTSTAGS